ncbi:MBL fold metallo-hydrolase [Roseovarius sp. C7]|uniref:MBL fold metallo-hydrolase n=1 Tax=Roseovarius sp. C7 TaxID=3398643 RepID=UPI0039F49AE9
MTDAFDLQSFDPRPGQPETLAPGLRRILAPNPSPMTFRGTNTYLLGTTEIAVIDPGPADPIHLEAILAALTPGQKITHIVVTHAHLDHSPLARPLAEATGAPVLAYGDALSGRSAVMQRLAEAGDIGGGEGVDHGFTPDILLPDNGVLEGDGWQLTALWTPGHLGNHLCFVWQDSIFCGDLVMGWASSLVSPPDGDLTDFMTSCQRLLALDPRRLFPGHGAPIDDPQARISWLIRHRQGREAAILDQLAQGPATAARLARAIYTDTAAPLLPAATRNVLAHLIDLLGKNIVSCATAPHLDAEFTLNSERI